MTDDPNLDPDSDPDKLKGPGGMTLRQIHEQVQKSVERDREAQAAHRSAAGPVAAVGALCMGPQRTSLATV